MKKSFYHFLMKFRQPAINNEIDHFAYSVYHDHSFPKQSEDYHELSNYLELHVDYMPTLNLFDQVWVMYVESEDK